MRQTTPGLTLAGIAALFLVACGGGGGGNSSSGGGTPNTPPVANAGTAQSVSAGAIVTLNGTASSDADGTIASYTWTQTAGSAVTLSSSGTTSQTTFIAPEVATASALTFSLVVTDNRGASSSRSTVTVTVNPLSNLAPTANPGMSQTTMSGATVVLDGSASADTDGNIAAFAWSQTAGIAVTLSSSSDTKPTFTAPAVTSATTLTFSLVVTDNRGMSSAASAVNVLVNPIGTGNTLATGKIT